MVGTLFIQKLLIWLNGKINLNMTHHLVQNKMMVSFPVFDLPSIRLLVLPVDMSNTWLLGASIGSLRSPKLMGSLVLLRFMRSIDSESSNAQHPFSGHLEKKILNYLKMKWILLVQIIRRVFAVHIVETIQREWKIVFAQQLNLIWNNTLNTGFFNERCHMYIMNRFF